MPIGFGVTTQTLPPWMNTLYQHLAERSEAESQRGYERWPENMRRYAELNPDYQQAFQLGRENLGQYEQPIQEAQELYRDSTRPYLQAYEDQIRPTIERTQNALAQRAGRNWREQVLPGLEGTFVGLGQHGSSLHADFARRAARQHDETMQEQAALAEYKGLEHAAKQFQLDKAAKAEAAKGIAPLGGLRQAGKIADIAGLTEQGAAQLRHEQGRLNMYNQDWAEQREHPWSQIQKHAAAVHGLPAQTSSFNAHQTPGAPQMNTAGNLMNIAGGLMSANMAYGRDYGRKAGGAVKGLKQSMNIPRLKKLEATKQPKAPKKPKAPSMKKKGLGSLSLTQMPSARKPTVGMKRSMNKKKVMHKGGVL